MANTMNWIKLSIDIFNDEKIRLIRSLEGSDSIINIWIYILTLAGKTNDSGLIYLEKKVPYTPEMIATLIGKTTNQVKYALKIISGFGMIELMEGGLISVVNWEKHQNIQGLDKVREQTRLRVQKHRQGLQVAIQQFIEKDKIVTSSYSNVTVTQQNIEIEKRKKNKKNKKEDIKRNVKEKPIRFSPPTKPEILTFFIVDKLLSEVDAEYRSERFINFYETKGWLVGKNKMVNWKTAAARSLEWEDKRKANLSPDKTSKYEKTISAIRECTGTTSTNF